MSIGPTDQQRDEMKRRVSKFFWQLESRIFGDKAGALTIPHFLSFEDRGRLGSYCQFHCAGIIYVSPAHQQRFDHYARRFWFKANSMRDLLLTSLTASHTEATPDHERLNAIRRANGRRGANLFYLAPIDRTPERLIRYCAKFSDTEHEIIARF